MGIAYMSDFDVSFTVKSHHVNAMRGLLVGYVEDPFGDGFSDRADIMGVPWRWLHRNIRSAGSVLDDLNAAGYLWRHDWDALGGVTVYGPTEAGLRWAVRELGLPVEYVEAAVKWDFANDEFPLWIIRNVEPHFARAEALKAHSTGAVVRQTRYTRCEAIEAGRLIDALVAVGTITMRSGAAYKAHVTRRTA